MGNIQTTIKKLVNIAASVFTLLAGLKLWISAAGLDQIFALLIILIGTIAVESNVSSMIKRRRSSTQPESRVTKSNQVN
jgi:hypothetical protein